MKRRLHLAAILALLLPSAVSALEIQQVESPGGIKAWLVEDHSIPFTAMEISFLGGTALEADDKIGATYLLTGMFQEGAGDLDAQTYQQREIELAASFSFEAYTESISVSLRFLTESRDESMALLRLALTEPRFDSDRLEFVRSQVLAIIADKETDPGEIGSEAVDRLTYGDHPFARPIEGTAETVAALTAEDLEAARRRALTRDGVVVAAAGDITGEDLGILLDDLLEGFPASVNEPAARPEFLLSGGTTVVEFPTPQSLILFLHEGFLRNDPDFLVAYVMNEMLGSQRFDSRLNEEVRRKRGLTYGISTYLGAHSNSGFIAGEFSTSNESVAEAIDIVKAEWAKMAGEGVSEEELERVKTYLTGAYPLRFDGNGRIAGILAAMQFDKLPASYVDNRNDMVNALTVEDINRVAARLLDPERLHFVVVGMPEGLAEE
ncbi:MAG: pitrilysin family protein [Rhodobacteraceae bacterium]|nr:pitrilysin family protein [Paracoccaceae bacterium]